MIVTQYLKCSIVSNTFCETVYLVSETMSKPTDKIIPVVKAEEEEAAEEEDLVDPQQELRVRILIVFLNQLSQYNSRLLKSFHLGIARN